MIKPARASKFNAKKTEVDGVVFASKAEAKRYGELRLLERAGEIRALELQPKWELVPPQRRPDGVAERAVSYVGDFKYLDRAGSLVVEDVKGMRLPEYVIKRKLMLHKFGIAVREVKR